MLNTDQTASGQVSDLLSKAAEWHLIALLWDSPRRRSLAQLECLVSRVEDPLLKETASLAENLTQEIYLQHFGLDGPIPLQETLYINGNDPEKILSQLDVVYRNVAFQPTTANANDHLAVEADFISHLYVVEARARIASDDMSARTAVTLREQFVEQHFRPLVKNVARKTSGDVADTFLKLLAVTQFKIQQS